MNQAYYLQRGEKVEILQPQKLLPAQEELENLRNTSIYNIMDILSSALFGLSKIATEKENLKRFVEETGWSEDTIISTFDKVKLIGSKQYLNSLLQYQLRDIEFLEKWLPVGQEVYVHAEPLGRGVNIGAGNSPISSILPEVWRSITKNACVHKMPSGDKITLELLNQVYLSEEKYYPLQGTFTACYWPGGCEEVENPLFKLIDYVMAWGSDSHVESARLRTPFPKRFLGFGQEYGMTVIEDSVINDEKKRKENADGVALDVSFGDQMYCTSTQFSFVEKSNDGNVKKFLQDLNDSMENLRKILKPGKMQESTKMDIRQEKETAMFTGKLFYGPNNLDYLVVYDETPPTELGMFPQHRFLRVYGVNNLSETFKYANKNMNNVSIAASDKTRQYLRNEFSKRGVKRIVSPGGTLPALPVIPWGAELPLTRLVEWHTDEYFKPQS